MKRVFWASVRAILAIIALLILALVGWVGYDMLANRNIVATITNTTFTDTTGVSHRAYLAQPAGNGPHPAVILIHEWWGLNTDITEKADELAAQGYVVLAPDAYRGATTRAIPRSIYLVSTTPQEQIDADIDAALAYLKQQPFVDQSRIGVMGFCFGGKQSLRTGTRHADLAATIVFYGNLITDSNALGELGKGGPVLGVFGAEDTSIPLSDVEQFKQAMQQRGIQHEVTVYPGVGHAFIPDLASTRQPGAAQDAWNQLLQFLRTNVKRG